MIRRFNGIAAALLLLAMVHPVEGLASGSDKEHAQLRFTAVHLRDQAATRLLTSNAPATARRPAG
jgi:hypothetical protein